MIFTRDFVTRENHWRIASLVTPKSLFTVTHALFFISFTVTSHCRYGAGVPLHVKTPSYQYRDPHNKDKSVSRPSHLYNGNLYAWKDFFISKRSPGSYNPFVWKTRAHLYYKLKLMVSKTLAKRGIRLSAAMVLI